MRERALDRTVQRCKEVETNRVYESARMLALASSHLTQSFDQTRTRTCTTQTYELERERSEPWCTEPWCTMHDLLLPFTALPIIYLQHASVNSQQEEQKGEIIVPILRTWHALSKTAYVCFSRIECQAKCLSGTALRLFLARCLRKPVLNIKSPITVAAS